MNDTSKHIDFITLKNRIEVCITTLPSIEKFINKFLIMHKKWLTNRITIFTQRKMTGGNADSIHICPLCSHDIRNVIHENNLPPQTILASKIQSNQNTLMSINRTIENEQRKKLKMTDSLHSLKSSYEKRK